LLFDQLFVPPSVHEIIKLCQDGQGGEGDAIQPNHDGIRYWSKDIKVGWINLRADWMREIWLRTIEQRPLEKREDSIK